MESILLTQSTNSNLTSRELMGSVNVPVIISKQGSRLTYQMNLMFRQITSLFDHTEPKPEQNQQDVHNLDIKDLRNRYLKPEKAKEIADYIYNNRDSYILPPVSAVAEMPFLFLPYNHREIIAEMGEAYDLIKYPERTEEVLEKFDGMLQGFIIFKESDFNVEILDGNHRVAAIHQLSAMGKEFKNLRIGVQIFVECDIDRQRQAFVDMNTSTPIDKTILTLFSNRDIIAIAARQTIGNNPEYAITEFDAKSEEYIGFDAVNDSITRNSNAVLSLNMVKNMLVKFALGDSGTVKKFQATYKDIKSPECSKLLKDFSVFMRAIFNNVESYREIKRNGIEMIPKLREEYISLTGAGLYIIAAIGFKAHSKNKNLIEVAEEISRLDWRRGSTDANGNFIPNSLFTGGILSSDGKISNTRNSMATTIEAIEKKLYL